MTTSDMITEIAVPAILANVDPPPRRLFQRGAALSELLLRPRVAIVGSRTMTPYGQRMTINIAQQLAAQGVVIISGLALGVDAAAHRAALEVGGTTIAVLPSALDNVVPHSHQALAQQIVAHGGTLISEYPPGSQPHKYNFVQRNRLMSGLADVIVVTQAALKSGTLHTATYALNQGRIVLAVPGDVGNAGSAGCNELLKSTRSGVATSYLDVLQALQLTATAPELPKVRGATKFEQLVLDLLDTNLSDGHELLQASGLSASDFNQVLTMLEIKGVIRPLGNNHWKVQS